MNTKSFTYIKTIAEEGSLSQAGRKLGISQPTLSVFLSKLESELGVDLFLREKKTLLPTPAGKIYLDAAERILRVKNLTSQTIHRLCHETTETITIGATPLRGSIVLAQIFPKFNQRYPNVKLEIKEAYTQELNELSRNRKVNFSLVSCFDTETPELDYIVISREEVVIGVPSFHPLAAQAAAPGQPLNFLSIGEIIDTPFVMMEQGTTIRSIADYVFAKENLKPTIAFETNNNLVLSNMIRQGAGAGFLPRSAMAADAQDVVYFSFRPRYYLNLAIAVSNVRDMSEAERYLAYLVIKKDSSDPRYASALNQYAKEIIREFEMEDMP